MVERGQRPDKALGFLGLMVSGFLGSGCQAGVAIVSTVSTGLSIEFSVLISRESNFRFSSARLPAADVAAKHPPMLLRHLALGSYI